MNESLTMAAVAGGASLLILVGVYLKFGRGLAMRIFGAVIPLMDVAVIISHFIGAKGTTREVFVPCLIVGVGVTVPWLLWIQRSVVSRLSTQISLLASSTSQIAATAKQSAATAAQQAATVAQVSATIEELQQTSAATAAAAKQVSATAREASRRGSVGVEAAGRAKAVLELVAEVTGLGGCGAGLCRPIQHASMPQRAIALVFAPEALPDAINAAIADALDAN